MNDEFLHRARKAPAPEFLKELKSRLDRQPPDRVPSPRRRWTFTRGLLAGLLLGGAAFAFLARLLPWPQQAPPQAQVHQRDAVPLGPVWLPNHPGSRPQVSTESVGLTQHGAGTGAGADPAATAAAATKNASPGGLPYFEQVTVVTSATTYPIAWSVANRFARNGQAKIEINSTKPFDRMCTNDPGAADVVELSRRITREEFESCARTRTYGIVEVKLGYQAVVLARAQLYGPLRLSARDVFLALARRVPDPNKPESLIDNPYTTWNQIAPALPYDRIQVLGPAPGTPDRKLMSSLLLEAGCKAFGWIEALRDSDPTQYEEICGSLREDSAYRVTNSTGWSYANELATNPTALGIFSLYDYSLSHAELLPNPIDGVSPTTDTLSAGTYPLARSLYLYASAYRSLGNQVFMNFVMYNIYGDGWGFVRLDKSDINANLAIAQERRAMRF